MRLVGMMLQQARAAKQKQKQKTKQSAGCMYEV
jgi:hypothetical protein